MEGGGIVYYIRSIEWRRPLKWVNMRNPCPVLYVSRGTAPAFAYEAKAEHTIRN